MADGHEQAGNFDFTLRAILADDETFQFLITDKACDRCIQDKLNIVFSFERIYQCALATKTVASMDEIHAAGCFRQKHSILQRTVASSIYRHGHIFEKGTITDGTITDAGANKVFFPFNTKHARFGASCNDDSSSFVLGTEFTVHTSTITKIINADDLFKFNVSTLRYGLLSHSISELGTADRHHRRKVFNLRAPCDLSAERSFFQN